MKNKLFLLLAAAFVITCAAFLSLTPAAYAQTATDAVTAASEAPPALVTTAETVVAPFIVTFAGAHPWVATLLGLIALLRVIFKPLVSLAEVVVRNTPSASDDVVVDEVEHSIYFKAFAWLLDFGASIKIGPQFTARQPAAPAASTAPAASA